MRILRFQRAGLAIGALSVDGPFLRLLPDSTKVGSCAVETGTGLDIEAAVAAGRAYKIALRDLTRAGNPDRRPVRVDLVVNLPNWQILRLPRQGNRSGRPTADLRQVMAAFARAQAAGREQGAPLEIAEIVIDYPWALIAQGRDLFRDRVRHLWNMTRDLGPGADGPSFGFIVNTLSYQRDCVGAEPNPVPFLPYRRGGAAIGTDCLIEQMGLTDADGEANSDRDYIADSLRYAEALRPGGELARVLVTADGTRIADHVAHLYFQSWGVNPVFNIWYMAEVTEYLSRR